MSWAYAVIAVEPDGLDRQVVRVFNLSGFNRNPRCALVMVKAKEAAEVLVYDLVQFQPGRKLLVLFNVSATEDPHDVLVDLLHNFPNKKEGPAAETAEPSPTTPNPSEGGRRE